MDRGRGATRALIVAIALVAASCGNSPGEDRASDNANDGESRARSGGDPAADRDTFLAVDAPGVTDDEINFASISTISNNPLGSNIGPAYNEGIEAYFAWRNSEGGLFGRDLVLDNALDDQLGQNADRAQELVSSDDAFGAFVATLLFTGAEVLDDNDVPTFAWGAGSELYGRRNLFGHIAPACIECVNRFVPYLASEAGASRVGVLAYNADDRSLNCATGFRDSIETFGEEAGDVEMAFFDDNLSFGLPGGLAPQVSAMREADVDYVVVCMDLNGTKMLAEELEKQGMGDVVVQHPNSYDEAFVAADAELFEGDIVLTTFTPLEAEIDSEVQEAFFTWTDRLGLDRLEFTMIGFINADLAFTGLLEAGPEFDRAAVVDAIRSLDNYSADNMIVPIDWSEQSVDPDDENTVRGFRQCTTAVRVEDGSFVQFTGEPGAPWACWDRRDEGYNPPEFMGEFG